MRGKVCLFCGALLLCLVGMWTYYCMPFARANTLFVIDRVRVSNSNQIVLIQAKNDSLFEPYSVYLLLFDRSVVRAYYISHEDCYWWQGRLQFAQTPEVVDLYRGTHHMGRLLLNEDELVLFHTGRVSRSRSLEESPYLMRLFASWDNWRRAQGDGCSE